MKTRGILLDGQATELLCSLVFPLYRIRASWLVHNL